MPYWLTRFDDIELPMLEASQDIGTGRARSSRTPLAGGGAYRLEGMARAKRSNINISASGEIVGVTLEELRAQYAPIRALWGTYGQLHRAVDGSDDDHWVWAEVVEVATDHTVEHVLWMPIDIDFVVDSPFWHGLRHGSVPLTWDTPGLTWDEGFSWDDVTDQVTLDTSPKTFTWSNGGDYPVNDGMYTITAGGSNLTAFTLRNTTNATGFDWTGTLVAGRQLAIDTARHAVEFVASLTNTEAAGATTLEVDSSAGAVVGGTVTILLDNCKLFHTTVATIPGGGVSITIPAPGLPYLAGAESRVGFAAYSGFTEALDEWLVLEPGDNSITVTRTGGGATTTILPDYFDGWS